MRGGKLHCMGTGKRGVRDSPSQKARQTTYTGVHPEKEVRVEKSGWIPIGQKPRKPDE